MNAGKPFTHILPARDGELLASWLLRICERQGGTYQAFSADNIGTRRWSPSIDVFPNLEDLYSLGAARRDDERKLISQHTLLELLHPYYSDTEWGRFVESLRQNASATPRTKMRNRENYIRVCPCCHSEGAMRGEVIWHRNHQIPGVRYCWKHEEPLLITTKRMGGRNLPPSLDELATATSAATKSIAQVRHHIRLARDLAVALREPLPCLGPNWVRETMPKVFPRRPGGAWASRGSFSGRAIRAKIDECFGEGFIDDLDLEPSARKCEPRAIERRTHAGLTMMAVVARAFGLTLDTILRNPRYQAPIERGPWKCLNTHSACGGKPTIARFVPRKTKGKFQCPICGLTYFRPLPLTALTTGDVTFPAVDSEAADRIEARWRLVDGDVQRVRAGTHLPIWMIYQVAKLRNLPHGPDRYSQKIIASASKAKATLIELVKAKPNIPRAQILKVVPRRLLILIRVLHPVEYEQAYLRGRTR